MAQEKKPKKTLNVLPDRMKASPRLAANDPTPPPSSAPSEVDETAALRCDRCDGFYLYAGKLWIDGDEVNVKLCGKCYVAAGNPSGLRKVDPPAQPKPHNPEGCMTTNCPKCPAPESSLTIQHPKPDSYALTIEDAEHGVVFSIDHEGNVKFAIDGQPTTAKVEAHLTKAFTDSLQVMAELSRSYLPKNLIRDTILFNTKKVDPMDDALLVAKVAGWNGALDAITQTLFPDAS